VEFHLVWILTPSYPEACRELDFLSIAKERFVGQVLSEPLNHCQDGVAFTIAHHEAEFISADPTGHISGSRMPREYGGETFDCLVSGGVSMSVVYQLKFVQIRYDYPNRKALSYRGRLPARGAV